MLGSQVVSLKGTHARAFVRGCTRMIVDEVMRGEMALRLKVPPGKTACKNSFIEAILLRMVTGFMLPYTQSHSSNSASFASMAASGWSFEGTMRSR